MKAPFPWFGGKSTVAGDVWAAFGNPPNYVEPFAGSAAMLLCRPHRIESAIETINDADGFVANFWRATQKDPDAVAHHADWPVNENDLHARHAWLVGQREEIVSRLEGDPEWFDTRIAGWWVWGMCCWIGSGFCSGAGPWRQVDGRLVNMGSAGMGVNRQRVQPGNAGQGINRKRVHLGDAGQGVNRQLVHLGTAGQGVNRQLVHLGDAGKGHLCPRCGDGECGLLCWIRALSDRLRRVRVCCGDWSRVCGPTPTVKMGLTGVFLDPPYGNDDRSDCYAVESRTVAAAVREWCLKWGSDDRMRIALCGYAGEGHDALVDSGWRVQSWKAYGGYGSQSDDDECNGRTNSHRERIWFSPHCLQPERELFPT